MGNLPLCFYGSETIFLPVTRSRKRPRCGIADADGFVIGIGERASRPHDTKLQHLAAIAGGRSAMAVTGLTIHDIVISPRFPTPNFFSNAF